MSVVTQMVIYTDFREDVAMGRLNQWCKENDPERQQQFCPLNVDGAGGTKWFTGQVWAMAGNHFPYERLIEALPTFGWDDPEDVLLLVQSEDSDQTRVYRATGERMSA